MRFCPRCDVLREAEEFDDRISATGIKYRDNICIHCREEEEEKGSTYTTGAAFIEGLEKNMKKNTEERDRYLSSGSSSYGQEHTDHSGSGF